MAMTGLGSRRIWTCRSRAVSRPIPASSMQRERPAHRVGDTAGPPPTPVVAAGAEGLGPGAGEDDHPDREVVTGPVEGVRHLDDRPRPEGITDLRAVDGALG